MTSHRRLALALTIVMMGALVTGAPAGAQPPKAAEQTGPLELVKATVSRVLAIVQAPRVVANDGRQRRADIRRAAQGLFDFREMARLTLAQHWKERSALEQEEFVRLFTELLEQSYLTTIENYAGEKITFQGESISGPYAQVRSRITSDRRMETSIEYRLRQHDAGWVVYDVVLDGVSLVSNYRSQFNSIIRTSSFADLLTKLRSKEIEAHVIPRPGRRS
ncbi:MAG TPA: ABC transporter substrate-binding protein [Methylomirabilota bacterium]|nr:ABC transporter substrate-binding protein [Methylomirabilota bacterium]